MVKQERRRIGWEKPKLGLVEAVPPKLRLCNPEPLLQSKMKARMTRTRQQGQIMIKMIRLDL